MFLRRRQKPLPAGKHFRMSRRFNRHSAADFGLMEQSENLALCQADGSLWEKAALYDYGWGPENGYYKLPLPDFPDLMEILLHEESDEDVYGAAAIIERDYPEALLAQCEQFMQDTTHSAEFQKLSQVFRLHSPINRCPVVGKTSAEIQSDSERWKRIADFAAASSCSGKG